ncbi:LPP20 family lipoprotein [Nitrincola alkalilacustris]|uniref:LPP20 family lipoprotein n=1 Tax=Nitrincola alkalilacustris TaxID=1571224 RepID=UPI00124D358B|nr:LPP20 family lipoprotein [Nitrincola alkalilacustris]
MKKKILSMLLLSALLLTGCSTVSQSVSSMVEAMPGSSSPPRIEVPAEPHWVSATGYAPISLQPGRTEQQKIIMAMRASKLQAYQELAAIINGQYLFGTTSVQDMVLQNDQFKASVAGIVRGARVIKSYPVQDDTYATVLEVDLNQVQRAWVHQY